jgi:multicomponent Na+:H+ antiporter subunit E
MNLPNRRQPFATPGRPNDRPARIASSAILRTVMLLGLWVILIGTDLIDLGAGFLAAIAATSASLRLMPPQRWNVRPLRATALVLRFLRQTTVAGLDVAWRALDPRLPLQPGIVTYRPHLPPGMKRDTFLSIMSLMPGTLPSGATEGGGVAIHCLDVAQPVAEQLATEESLFVRAFGDEQDND